MKKFLAVLALGIFVFGGSSSRQAVGQTIFGEGHTYAGHTYAGHTYAGHTYAGHTYAGHTYAN